jgi:hypothetical protein
MSGPKTAYFDRRMVNRERLIWTVATRRQLERWEPLVAESVRRRNDDRQLDKIESAAVVRPLDITEGGRMFSFSMVLADGAPADPPTFVSAIPNWRVGDDVRIGAEVRYRIIGLQQADEEEPPTWIVEPVRNGD